MTPFSVACASLKVFPILNFEAVHAVVRVIGSIQALHTLFILVNDFFFPVSPDFVCLVFEISFTSLWAVEEFSESNCQWLLMAVIDRI